MKLDVKRILLTVIIGLVIGLVCALLLRIFSIELNGWFGLVLIVGSLVAGYFIAPRTKFL